MVLLHNRSKTSHKRFSGCSDLPKLLRIIKNEKILRPDLPSNNALSHKMPCELSFYLLLALYGSSLNSPKAYVGSLGGWKWHLAKEEASTNILNAYFYKANSWSIWNAMRLKLTQVRQTCCRLRNRDKVPWTLASTVYSQKRMDDRSWKGKRSKRREIKEFTSFILFVKWMNGRKEERKRERAYKRIERGVRGKWAKRSEMTKIIQQYTQTIILRLLCGPCCAR